MSSILVAKQGHKRFPKAFIKEITDGWSLMLYDVLEPSIKGIDVITLGYQYASISATIFLVAKGAAHTELCVLYSTDFSGAHTSTIAIERYNTFTLLLFNIYTTTSCMCITM